MKHAFSKVVGYITYLLAYVISMLVKIRCYSKTFGDRRVEIILFGENIQILRVYRITDSGLRTIIRSVRRLSIEEVNELNQNYIYHSSRQDLVSSRTKQSKGGHYGNS